LNQSGFTATVAKNRLPAPQSYFHTKTVVDNSPGTLERKRATQALTPVVATQDGRPNTYVSMMSTQGVTWHTVNNSVASVQCFMRTRKKGQLERDDSMNEIRELYLATYGALDRFDAYLFRLRLFLGSRKRYYSCVTEFVWAASVIQAWQDHIQLLEDHDGADGWSDLRPLEFEEFVIQLGRKMMTYTGSSLQYPGEESLTQNTRKSYKRRSAASVAANAAAAAADAEASSEPQYLGRGNSRVTTVAPSVRYPTLASDVVHHFALQKTLAKMCHHCGKRTRMYDPVCGVPLHAGDCAVAYHDPTKLSWEDDRKATC